MQVATIEIDREEARKRVEEFTAKRRKKLTEMDQALYRGYKALSEGLTLIDVNQAIKAGGGHFEDNYCPKLAIARSDTTTVYFEHSFSYSEGQAEHGGRFSGFQPGLDTDRQSEAYKEAARVADEKRIGLWVRLTEIGLRIELEAGSIDSPPKERLARKRWFKADYRTIVPTIPFHLRPNGDAANYFILWEVEKWEEYRNAPAPGDPLLLERIAHPIYVVVAQWDLSELEKRILESFRR